MKKAILKNSFIFKEIHDDDGLYNESELIVFEKGDEVEILLEIDTLEYGGHYVIYNSRINESIVINGCNLEFIKN